MRESGTVEAARRALGAQLAGYRRASGYSQAEFASVIEYSRSTVANVETGRQNVPRSFWTRADEALPAGGALAEASDEVGALVRREREEATRLMRPFLPAVTRGHGADAKATALPVPADPGAVPDDARGWLGVVAVAVGEARDHAERIAVFEIGPATVQQLTADVVRLGRAYVSAPPLPLFAAMHRALGRVQAAIDQKAYPGQTRDLTFLGGALCGLMANASLDLGWEDAADDLARAAWAYGRVIDHGPLMGWARGTQALAAISDNRYGDAGRHAEDGLAHAPAGTGMVRLHAIHARALSARGDRAQARAAMTAAGQASTDSQPDELHDGVAGEFSFDEAKLWYYRALTLNDADDPAGAEHAASVAVGLYRAAPARTRSYGCAALAQVQLARARLMNGKLEEAADVLRGVLALDPQLRIGSLTQHLDTCRELLGLPACRSPGIARQLDQQLAAFSNTSAALVPLTRAMMLQRSRPSKRLASRP